MERYTNLWCAVLDHAIADAQAPKPEWVERDWEAIAKRRHEQARERGKPLVKNVTARTVRNDELAKYKRAITMWDMDRAYIGGPSFEHVCHLAGVDPDEVARRVRTRMAA